MLTVSPAVGSGPGILPLDRGELLQRVREGVVMVTRRTPELLKVHHFECKTPCF